MPGARLEIRRRDWTANAQIIPTLGKRGGPECGEQCLGQRGLGLQPEVSRDHSSADCMYAA